MRVLFICNQNKHRSRTAEDLFRGDFETRSAGLYNDRPVSRELLEWADFVVVMEGSQRAELGRRFPNAYLKKRIISLEVPDIYQRDQPELVSELKRKFEAHLVHS